MRVEPTVANVRDAERDLMTLFEPLGSGTRKARPLLGLHLQELKLPFFASAGLGWVSLTRNRRK